MLRVDLNCDLGEGAGHDEGLMPLITSANIACGGHAGDGATMRATVELARKHGVAIGAHPGFADRENFGRRETALSPGEAGALVVAQLHRFCTETQAGLHHVKLHGALYHQAARDSGLAREIVLAIQAMRRDLLLYAPGGSELARAAKQAGLRVAGEVFADRTYRPDGSLTPRSHPGALITDENAAVAQVLRMVREGLVRATDGTDVAMAADTVCLHGDGPDPVAFARGLRGELAAAGIAFKTCGT